MSSRLSATFVLAPGTYECLLYYIQLYFTINVCHIYINCLISWLRRVQWQSFNLLQTLSTEKTSSGRRKTFLSRIIMCRFEMLRTKRTGTLQLVKRTNSTFSSVLLCRSVFWEVVMVKGAPQCEVRLCPLPPRTLNYSSMVCYNIWPVRSSVCETNITAPSFKWRFDDKWRCSLTHC